MKNFCKCTRCKCTCIKSVGLNIDVPLQAGFISFDALKVILKNVTTKAGKLTNRDMIYLRSHGEDTLKVTAFRYPFNDLYGDKDSDITYFRYADAYTGEEVPYEKD